MTEAEFETIRWSAIVIVTLIGVITVIKVWRDLKGR